MILTLLKWELELEVMDKKIKKVCLSKFKHASS